jgi:hypothetical protein
MSSAIDHFVSELRAHECLAQSADEIQTWINDSRNDWRNRHSINFLKAIEWIAARSDHSIVERLTQMGRLTQFEVPVIVSMALFTGWKG